MINPLSPLIRLLIAILCLILLSPLHSKENKTPSSASKINAFWQHFLDHNIPIAQARAQILTQEGRLIQWQASLFPKIKTQALALPVLIEIESTQALLRPTTPHEIKIAQLSTEAAEYNLYATIEHQIDLLRHAALDYLYAQQVHKKENDYHTQWQSQLPILQALYESNQFPNHDLSWAKTQSLAQKQHALQSQQMLKQTQNNLEALTNLPLHRIPHDLLLSLAAWNSSIRPPPQDPPPWQQRPEYKKILTHLQSTEAQILLIPKLLYPTIEAFAKAELAPDWITLKDFSTAQNEDEPSNRRSPDQSRSSAGLRFYWLIYDGGDTAGQYHTGQATRIQAQLFQTQWQQHYQSAWKQAHHILTVTEESIRDLQVLPRLITDSTDESRLSTDASTRRQYLDSLLLSREIDLRILHLKKQKAAAMLTLQSLAGENLRFVSQSPSP